MTGRRKAAWAVCVVATAMALGLGAVLCWLIAVAQDDQSVKYYPLIAPLLGAVVSGCATIGGVVVAYMLLRFNYRNQVNPIRVELYKYQIGMLNRLMAQALKLFNAFADDDKERLLAEFGGSRNLMLDESVFLPNAVREKYSALYMKCYQGWFEKAKLEVKARHPYTVDTWDSHFVPFLEACRKVAGTEGLTSAVMRLAEVDQA